MKKTSKLTPEDIRMIKDALKIQEIIDASAYKTIQAITDYVDESIKNVRKEIQEVKTDLTELKEDIKQVRIELKFVKKDIGELKSDITLIKEDLTEIHSDITDLHLDLTIYKKGHKDILKDHEARIISLEKKKKTN